MLKKVEISKIVYKELKNTIEATGIGEDDVIFCHPYTRSPKTLI